MRLLFLIVCVVLMLNAISSPCEAQKPKKKKAMAAKAAAKAAAAKPSDGGPRFSTELRELLAATSSGYELDGQAVAPALGVAAILKAANSPNPKIQELGRLHCDLAYLSATIRQQQPDPELSRIAKADMPLGIKFECLKTVSERVPAGDLARFGLKADFMETLLEEGRKRGSLVNPDDSLIGLLLDAALDAAVKNSLAFSETSIVGLAKGLAAKQRIVALTGAARTASLDAADSIDAKLETTSKGHVVVAVTNQTSSPMRNCLLLARSIPNPQAVERTVNSEIAAINALDAFVGVGKEKTKIAAYVDILYRSVLHNLERGGIVFVPELPMNGTVRVGLVPAKDMAYVKGSEISLWSDAGEVEGLSLGTWTGIPPELAGEPLTLGDKPTAIKTELTGNDPRDPQVPPHQQAKVCKVFSAFMDEGKTYIIESAVDGMEIRVSHPPLLRVENDKGESQTTSREKSLSKSQRISFMPSTAGTYRIVCTEAFGGPGRFTLSVYTRAAKSGGQGISTSATKADGGAEGRNPLKMTVNDVEYVYQGITRKGEQAMVTLLAKSLDGVKQGPQGKMVLVDLEGNQFEGFPIGGFGVPPQLREGVPLKLIWVFGKRNAFDVAPRPIPSAKIKQFAHLSVETGPGGGDSGIEFREIPAVVPAAVGK